jgi:hypothetical protein
MTCTMVYQRNKILEAFLINSYERVHSKQPSTVIHLYVRWLILRVAADLVGRVFGPGDPLVVGRGDPTRG